MRGRIVQVREYVGRPRKYLVIELEDDAGLHEAIRDHKGVVDLEPLWWEEPDGEGTTP